MQHTTRDGRALHVHVDGPADAPLTVVLAHCWTSDLTSWGYQALDVRGALGDQVRVLRYDHRGHGRSDRIPEPEATVEHLAADLEELLETHAPAGNLVLGGHSIGGMTVLGLAERAPALFGADGRVKGVALVSTSGGGLDTVSLGLPAVTGDALRAQLPRVLATRARMLSRRQRRRHPLTETMIARRVLLGPGARRVDVRLAVNGMINTPAESMCGFYRDLMRHDRLDALTALDGVPVHVLVGSRDLLTPPEHAARLAEAVPGAQLTVAQGAGHYLPLERDFLVSEALVDLARRALSPVEHPTRAPV
ncbi:MAG: alpha/beta fold hydrolase [Nocardioides sp.]|nr:alpha/beta fold hydrolase [Nocardioides sp.]